MNKSVLVLYSKSICYNSVYTFSKELTESFEKLGYQVDFLSICNNVDDLLPYCHKKYDYIVDFNSTLPLKKFSNGKKVLDCLQGEFFNYLLDHPLYHHASLEQMESASVICIDKNHCRYIDEFYPNVERTLFIPVGCMKAKDIDSIGTNSLDLKSFSDRKIELLFTGTYTSKKQIDNKIRQCHPDLQKEILDIYELMKDDYSIELPDALDKYAHSKYGIDIPREKMAEFTCTHFLCDTALQAFQRDQVIRVLLDAHIPITVCGAGWEQFESDDLRYLNILPPVSFEQGLELASQAKILLNVLPYFKNGIHDRILTAMSHGAVSLTDSNEYLVENFHNKEDICFYSMNQLDELPSLVDDLLQKRIDVEALRANAFEKVNSQYSWEKLLQEAFC